MEEKTTDVEQLRFSEAWFGNLCIASVKHIRANNELNGEFLFTLHNLLPALGFDQNFNFDQLKNHNKKSRTKSKNHRNRIKYDKKLVYYSSGDESSEDSFCEQKYNKHSSQHKSESKQDMQCKWEWCRNIFNLQCMQSEMFVLGKYDMDNREMWYTLTPNVTYNSENENEDSSDVMQESFPWQRQLKTIDESQTIV